jgi:excinuclease ABC subunit A
VKKYIQIRGAKTNNLQNISIDIPRNALTTITGVSGSGKSSLAFETIYAEGQRRFVESLSSYARQFLERMRKPEVESITGLPPAIAIEQKGANRNPRSTVGTTTEVYDFMRVLYGRIAKVHCKKCGNIVKKHSAQSIVEELQLHCKESERMYILIRISQESNFQETIQTLRENGLSRYCLMPDTTLLTLEENPPTIDQRTSIAFLIDRIVFDTSEDGTTRMTESIEQALRFGRGYVEIYSFATETTHKFSSSFDCATCSLPYQEPEPKLYSFNSSFGACPTCQGFGRSAGINWDLVIPDPNKSLDEGAIEPLTRRSFEQWDDQLLNAARERGISRKKPWNTLDEEDRNYLLHGDDDYSGVRGFFEFLERSTTMQNRILYARYRGYTKCNSCNGSRLRVSARYSYVHGKSIPDLVSMNLEQLLEHFLSIVPLLTPFEQGAIGKLIEEIIWRVRLLVDIGVEYLTLDRLAHTLSGGEMQRISLASAIGSSLVGTLYVLDEPSIGLHPRDTQRLINILKRLKNLGNTVIVVEHDPDIMKASDFIIDIGPKAGRNGGEILFSGTYDELLQSSKSLTAEYLNGTKRIDFTTLSDLPDSKVLKMHSRMGVKEAIKPKAQLEKKFGAKVSFAGKTIDIVNPRTNNLKPGVFSFPLEKYVVVTGVSGSGKSTLVHDTLYQRLKLGKEVLSDPNKKIPEGIGECEEIRGIEYVSGVELIDQSPIGRSTRSTAVTYTKAFDYIRETFANTQSSQALGWKPGHYSFNVPGGRCDVCEGAGVVTVEMQFLPDVTLECEVCKGTRYKREAQQILYKGKSIVDVLKLSVDEAVEFFAEEPKIVQRLTVLQDVGLGYVSVGQSTDQLSGGELQRVKLAKALETEVFEHTMFIFDEPTTGLHLDDIAKLIRIFKYLVSRGHSVVVIEHNIHVMATADWIIDIGPEGGDNGGMLVADGSPETVAKHFDTYTAKALKEFLMNEPIGSLST